MASENYSRHLKRTPSGLASLHADGFHAGGLSCSSSTNLMPPFRRSEACSPETVPRKTVLVNYGFRLPSALDNRPLNFEEFMAMSRQIIYVSATPGEFELRNSVVGNASLYCAIPANSFASERTPASPCGLNSKSKIESQALLRPSHTRRASRD